MPVPSPVPVPASTPALAPVPAPAFAPSLSLSLAPSPTLVPAATVILSSSSPAPAPAAVIAVGSSLPPAPQGDSQGAQKGKSLRKKRTISGPKTTGVQPKKTSKKMSAQKKTKKLFGRYVLLIILSVELPLVHPLQRRVLSGVA